MHLIVILIKNNYFHKEISAILGLNLKLNYF